MDYVVIATSGTYTVYLSDDNSKIIKIAHKEPDSVNSVERLVRIWNELNPESLKAQLLKPHYGKGWICPAITNGYMPLDWQISKALIHFFESTGRVIINAPECNTLLLTDKMRMVCLDVKMALRIAPLGEPHTSSGRYRRTSDTSSLIWSTLKDSLSSSLEPYKVTFPLAVATIKTLLYIRMHRPKIYEVNFLFEDSRFLEFFAKAYDTAHDLAMNATALRFLDKVTVPGRLFIGSGTYNRVYLSPDELTVRKIQIKPTEHPSDSPARLVRIWDELNGSHHLPPAQILDARTSEFPYIKGKQPSDSEIAKELIVLFNNTGRIVADAISPGNFIKTPEGTIICVDVGMAVQLEQRTEVFFAPGRTRRKSTISLDFWKRLIDKSPHYWKGWFDQYPQTINTIKALLFIKEKRPDIFDVSFLIENTTLANDLAKAYDTTDKTYTYAEELAHLDVASSATRGILDL